MVIAATGVSVPKYFSKGRHRSSSSFTLLFFGLARRSSRNLASSVPSVILPTVGADVAPGSTTRSPGAGRPTLPAESFITKHLDGAVIDLQGVIEGQFFLSQPQIFTPAVGVPHLLGQFDQFGDDLSCLGRYSHPDGPHALGALRRGYAEGAPRGQWLSDNGPQRHAETVLTQLGGWLEDYNTHAPHSALGMRSPADYRAEQLTLSSSR